MTKHMFDFFTEKTSWLWNPGDLNSFLPGSQEYIIKLTEELVKKNHTVTVFYDGFNFEKNGVKYRNRKEYDGTSQVAIGCMDTRSLPDQFSADILGYFTTAPEDNTKTDFSQFDFIVGLSDYHTDELGSNVAKTMEKIEEVAKEEIDIYTIYFGLDPEEFKIGHVERIPNQMLYASSWDRGLLRLLQSWKKIRADVKGATLVVTYGSGFSSRVANIKEQSYRAAYEKLLKQPGIREVGPVTREEMARLYLESDILAYPCTGGERFCNTVWKAQYAGCIPITTNVMALNETNVCGFAVPPKDWLETLTTVANSERMKSACRRNIKEKMTFPTWSEIADVWLEKIGEFAKANKE